MSKILRFKSNYRGQGEYLVMQGPLMGKRITVRYLKPEWYQDDYDKNVGKVYGDDPKNYRQEVMQAVGLVCCSGHRVDDDVVLAVNELYGRWQKEYPDLYFQGIFLPGWYEAGSGWQIDIDRPADTDAASAVISA